MSRKYLIWIFASITLILAVVVLYQQQILKSNSRSMKIVTPETNTAVLTPEPTTWTITIATTWQDNTGTVQQNVTLSDTSCVTSYQALIDRAQWLWEIAESDSCPNGCLAQALANTIGLWYCNWSTPKESDFLTISSNNQTLSYDASISGGALKIDSTTIVPDFIKTCGDTCPVVQAIRTVRSDNKYVVLETTQARSYQSSFRLISTSNGTTMLFWSSLSFVDPVASYAWSKDGHFAFIGSAGRSTDTYIVQPKWFPKTTQIPDEIDTPVALSVAGDTLVVIYDRNPSNTDLSDRYTKIYNINSVGQQADPTKTGETIQ
jgi:hypothetical protein